MFLVKFGNIPFFSPYINRRRLEFFSKNCHSQFFRISAFLHFRGIISTLDALQRMFVGDPVENPTT